MTWTNFFSIEVVLLEKRLVTSGGDHCWKPVQTCSFGDPLQSDMWWWPLKLKHVRFPSRWCTLYWKVFL